MPLRKRLLLVLIVGLVLAGMGCQREVRWSSENRTRLEASASEEAIWLSAVIYQLYEINNFDLESYQVTGDDGVSYPLGGCGVSYAKGGVFVSFNLPTDSISPACSRLEGELRFTLNTEEAALTFTATRAESGAWETDEESMTLQIIEDEAEE